MIINSEHYLNDQDYLEHYGVKGMRWGHRKAADSASSAPSARQVNRQKNKASRSADKAKIKSKQNERKQATLDARARIKSKESKQTFKDQKKQYKKNKAELGSREARKILNSARAQYNLDYALSRQVVDAKSLVREILLNSAGVPTPRVGFIDIEDVGAHVLPNEY